MDLTVGLPEVTVFFFATVKQPKAHSSVTCIDKYFVMGLTAQSTSSCPALSVCFPIWHNGARGTSSYIDVLLASMVCQQRLSFLGQLSCPALTFNILLYLLVFWFAPSRCYCYLTQVLQTYLFNKYIFLNVLLHLIMLRMSLSIRQRLLHIRFVTTLDSAGYSLYQFDFIGVNPLRDHCISS